MFNNTTNSHSTPTPTFHPHPKIEFPKFNGADPKGWVLKAEQYFEFVQIEEGKKVKLVVMHFEGKAYTWYRYYQSSKRNVQWKLFQADVISRFENPEQLDVQDQFNKLKQTTTVTDYEDRFEELRALVVHKNKGFNEEYFLSSFISGLKDSIKLSVRMFRPATLADAIYLAKKEETKLSKNMYSTNKSSSQKYFPQPSATQKFASLDSQNTASKVVYKGNNRPMSTLSSKEILERRSKGLCFHCDEPFHPGSDCKSKLYKLVGEKIEDDLLDFQVGEEVNLTDYECPREISLNALVDNKSTSTIRLQGTVKGRKVHLLIDSGSTHSFVDMNLVKQLKLTPEVDSLLLVKVANGNSMVVDSVCKNLGYEVQN